MFLNKVVTRDILHTASHLNWPESRRARLLVSPAELVLFLILGDDGAYLLPSASHHHTYHLPASGPLPPFPLSNDGDGTDCDSHERDRLPCASSCPLPAQQLVALPPVTLSFISACSGGEIFVVAEVKPQICLVFLSGKGIKKKKRCKRATSC